MDIQLQIGRLFPVYVSILVLVFVGVGTIWRVRREFTADGRLSIRTTVLVWGVYLFHAGLTGIVVWHGLVPMPIPATDARGIGSLVLVAGLATAGAGVREFRSVSRLSGRDEDKLVTTGIYRWSRNPQNVGWLLALIGMSLLGRSALAIVLVGLFALLLHVYLVYVEEPHLTRVFGSTYQQYRSQTPRYLGIGRRQHSRRPD